MEAVIIVVHLLLAIAMIFLVLIQQSEGGLGSMGGGGGGAGGGMGGFMTGRATASLLTRSTGILATAFFATSMTLAILADRGNERGSILDQPAPVTNQTTTPAIPTVPTVPSVPNQ